MYPSYKSKSGYYIDDDDIDSYGVDHKNFSTREELEYQMDRQERENEFANQNNIHEIKSYNNNYLVPKEVNAEPDWGGETSKKLNDYLQNNDNYTKTADSSIIAPFKDMYQNYKDMKNNNLVGADNFFHCKANYEAAKRGKWGEIVGKSISTGRELYGLIKGDPLSDTLKDWRANTMGWNGAKKGLNLKQACPTNPKEYIDSDYYKKFPYY